MSVSVCVCVSNPLKHGLKAFFKNLKLPMIKLLCKTQPRNLVAEQP